MFLQQALERNTERTQTCYYRSTAKNILSSCTAAQDNIAIFQIIVAPHLMKYVAGGSLVGRDPVPHQYFQH